MYSSTANWSHCWGDVYGHEYKLQDVLPVLDRFDAERGLGEVILDVGSGKHLYLDMLTRPHSIVAVDIAGAAEKNGSVFDGVPLSRAKVLGAQYDIRKITDSSARETRSVLAKVGGFLGVDCQQGDSQRQIDTVYFGDIFNYLDYPVVLNGISRYMKVGGKVAIANQPGRGYGHLFAPERPQNNTELLMTLEKLGFELLYRWDDVLIGENENNCYTVMIARFPEEISTEWK